MMTCIRGTVPGPLALLEAGARPTGVRWIEASAPDRAREMEATVCRYERKDCSRSLYAAADLYRSLRGSVGAGIVVPNVAAEQVAMRYLDNLQS